MSDELLHVFSADDDNDSSSPIIDKPPSFIYY